MPHFHLRYSLLHYPSNNVPTTFLWPLSGYVVEDTQCNVNTVHFNRHVAMVKNMSPSFTFVSCPRVHPFGALQISVDVGDASDSGKCDQSKVSENQNLNEEDQVVSNDSEDTIEDHKERQRRRKIGLANKGRVPWNKGKKHTAETCDRIKQRTLEALRDPKVKSCKVRKKMSEHPRPHSDRIKAKISSSLRCVWQERLKLKYSRERFFWSWAESIAKTAKNGFSNQQELEWDSYDRMKQEIVHQELQWVAVKAKAKAKQMAKARAERLILSWAECIAKVAKKGGSDQQELDWDSFNKIKQEMVLQQLQWTAEKAKAKEMGKIRSRLAQKRKEREEKARARGEIKRKTQRKLKEDREDFAVPQVSKLKQKPTKVHIKESVNVQVTGWGNTVVSHFGGLEKLDLEIVKREKMRREVSLADQIQVARIKKSESMDREALAASSSDNRSNKNTEE